MTSPSGVRYRPVLVDDEPQAHVSSDSCCLELLDLPPELRPLIVEQLHRVVDRACLKEACHALHRAWPRLPKLRVEDIGPRAPRWQWAVSTGLTPEAATLAGGLNLPTLDGESMQLFGPTNSDLDQWANVEGVSFATQSAAYKEHYGCCSGLLALFVFRAWMIVPRAFVYVVQLATRAFLGTRRSTQALSGSIPRCRSNSDSCAVPRRCDCLLLSCVHDGSFPVASVRSTD